MPLLPWIPWLLQAGMIFLLSSVPGDGFPAVTFGKGFLPDFIAENPDKMFHGFLYAVLTWFAFRAVFRTHSNPYRTMALAVILSAIYGATDEWHQFYVPMRSCDIMDWLADVSGGLLAVGVCYLIYVRRRHAPSQTS